jgi:hypothetical protein
MELVYRFGRNDEEFTYEIDDDQVVEQALNFYCNTYGVAIGGCRSLLAGLISDELLCYEDDEEFIEFLHEQFYKDAEEAYNDYCEYRRDPYGYYGVSKSDFH